MLPASNWTYQDTRVGERERGDTYILYTYTKHILICIVSYVLYTVTDTNRPHVQETNDIKNDHSTSTWTV